MTVSSFETLLIFVLVFGVIGAMRGRNCEFLTLLFITLTTLLLIVSGVGIFQQLPVRAVAGLLAMMGNQSASNDVAAHPLTAPWTNITLFIVVLSLIILAYAIGQKFGKELAKEGDSGTHFLGFVLGSVNGMLIAFFLFQNGFANLNIQFPDGNLSRDGVKPMLLIALASITIVYVSIRRKPEKPAEKAAK